MSAPLSSLCSELAAEHLSARSNVEDWLQKHHGDTDVNACLAVVDSSESDCVVLGGSVSSGFGTATSDLDALVLCEEDGPHAAELPMPSFVGDLLIDVHYINPTARDRLVQRIESAAAATLDQARELSIQQRKLTLRLATGCVAVSQKENPAIGALRKALPAAMTGHHIAELLEHVAFHELAWRAGDELQARRLITVLIRDSIEVLLAKQGSPYVGVKWLGRRLERNQLAADCFETVTAWSTNSKPDPATRAAILTEILGLDLAEQLEATASRFTVDVVAEHHPVLGPQLFLLPDQAAVLEIGLPATDFQGHIPLGQNSDKSADFWREVWHLVERSFAVITKSS